MTISVTITRTAAKTFGEPSLVTLDVNMVNGTFPIGAIRRAIDNLQWHEQLVINRIMHIQQAGDRREPALYGKIVGQPAMTNVALGFVNSAETTSIALGFVQGSLFTTLAAVQMSMRDAKHLGIIERIEDDGIVYTQRGLAVLAARAS